MSFVHFMETAGKDITRYKEKEGVKETQKAEGFCVDESGWIHCPYRDKLEEPSGSRTYIAGQQYEC